MRYAPAILMAAGLVLVGYAIYQIDSPYLTLVAGAVIALFAFALMIPGASKD